MSARSTDANQEDVTTPLRRCAISRNRRPKEVLLRFVADKEGKLTEDLAGRLPGRGIYVLADQKRVTALLAKHKISKEEIAMVVARVEQALVRRLLDGVGLSRRASSCRVGIREVEELLRRGQRPLLLLASDATTIRDKLTHLLSGMDHIEVLEILDQKQLGSLWGDRLVSLVAVTNLGVGQRIRIDATRWRSFMRVSEMQHGQNAACQPS